MSENVPTPRTDAMSAIMGCKAEAEYFTRTLERELAAAQATIAQQAERIAELEKALESHAWEISPAMAQAKIDELNRKLLAEQTAHAATKAELEKARQRTRELEFSAGEGDWCRIRLINAGCESRVKLGEDLHGNEDFMRVGTKSMIEKFIADATAAKAEAQALREALETVKHQIPVAAKNIMTRAEDTDFSITESVVVQYLEDYLRADQIDAALRTPSPAPAKAEEGSTQ